jgi:hypothetical protein
MSFIRGLITDLRDKRLWPVAAALVVALVAVPVLLSKPAPTVPVAQAAPQNAAVAPAAAVPAVSVQVVPSHSRLPGPARDPFTQRQHGGGAAAATSSTTATTVTGTGKGAGTGSTPASGTPTAPSTAPGTTTTPSSTAPLTYLIFTADLVVDRVGGHPETVNDVERLTPLPSTRNAFLVFLGIKNDRNTAEFLVSSHAKPAGQGKCIPSPSQCQLLALKVGQHEAFLVLSSHGRVYEYTLLLKNIGLKTTTSATVAQRAYASESQAGAAIVSRTRAHSIGLRSIAYSGHTGLLHDRFGNAISSEALTIVRTN